MKRVIASIGALSTAAVLGVGLAQAPDSEELGQHRSWGYHVIPDGNAATPAAPPTTAEVQPAGRVNVHSGGREGGKGDKRHGGGGRRHAFTDDGILIIPEIQQTGRTNVHSGGRPHNTAQPRHGGSAHNRVTKGVRKL